MKNHCIKYTISIFLIILYFNLQAQSEAYYIDLLALKLNAQKEVRVENGRVDLLTRTHAIEVEWATNWKHSVGQALWYAMQTNTKPGIILIMKDISERRFAIMLQSAIDYAGLTDKIDLWFYPEDFNTSFAEMQSTAEKHKLEIISKLGNYSLNKKSGVRHNSRCSSFNCDNCVPASQEEGRACGKCGG